MTKPKIDRPALVRRHNPEVRALEPFSALSVGNGQFAFTADVTGLQTFPAVYREKFPLCTASHWGWHSVPLPPGLRPEDIRATPFDAHGRPVGYITDRTGQEALFDALRQNPHRLHLGRIGWEMTRGADGGTPVGPEAIGNVRQTLDLWTGVLHSRFEVDGVPVSVLTACHPDQDMIAVRVESPLVGAGRLRVLFAFPYGSPGMDMADWGREDRHRTAMESWGNRGADFRRELDADRYAVRLEWSAEGALLTQRATHEFTLSPARGHDTLEFSCRFSPGSPDVEDAPLPGVAETVVASGAHWTRFWEEGGVIDLSGSADPRAAELERRVVLSQFVTALHCAGPLPSAETGLLCNSWYGKFHLEMHWWHGVHFATWGRFSRFAASLGYYRQILPRAREAAARQGYRGARWPKMVGPEGRDAPSPVGPLLIWQQPHPIYYAELCWRQRPTRETLEAWREIVFESAEFMASYAVFDPQSRRFVLGPPLKTVSENTDPRTATNPSFELSYWRFGLRVAQEWRARLGLEREPHWDTVLSGLAPLPVHEGVYLLQEGMTDTFTRWNWEHPAHVGAYGMLPGDGANAETMRRTVRRTLERWEWDRKCWGWDFPMTAMAAARSGEPELAVDALLLDVDKNRYLPNGHVYQRADLPAYLPANGGLLAAVGMMAAGWTVGEPLQTRRHAPGFPETGWEVRHEGIEPWL